MTNMISKKYIFIFSLIALQVFPISSSSKIHSHIAACTWMSAQPEENGIEAKFDCKHGNNSGQGVVDINNGADGDDYKEKGAGGIGGNVANQALPNEDGDPRGMSPAR